MPSILVIEYDPYSQYCSLRYRYNKRFDAFLRAGVKPHSYRRFDPSTKQWMVHHSKLSAVITAGKKYFDHVDYRSLPDDLQIKIISMGHIPSWSYQDGSRTFFPPIPTTEPESPRNVLHVTQSAPREVVTAAYKALAQKYHPDKGGSTEAFQKIQEAYDEIKQEWV